MGGVLSSFGFNQPFFITLIGIVVMLMLTLALVSDPSPSFPSNGGGHEFEGVVQSQPPIYQNHSAQFRLVKKKCCGTDSSSHLLLSTPLNHPR
uniref:Uncharacterized protein n=1 Tax=Ditylenchus dipsaci TaxID=166011 RepID=A0A915DC00_9BILA